MGFGVCMRGFRAALGSLAFALTFGAAALLSAGADLAVAPRVTVGFGYTGELAAHARDNAVKGFLSWKF
jgi:uncharacterized protein with beta-barrel porin domain